MPRGPASPVRAKTSANERPRAERDEDLLAAQHPPVAVALGPRLEAARVGARTRLGERVAAERLAGRERRQQRGPLLVGAAARDRLPVEAVRDGDDPAHVRVGPTELLDDERVRDHVEPHAAVLLGQRGGEEARGRLAGRRARGRSPRRGPTRRRAARSPRRRTSRAVCWISCCSSESSKSTASDPTHEKTAEPVALSSTLPTDRSGLAPVPVARRGFDLLALRAQREPHCTTAHRGRASRARDELTLVPAILVLSPRARLFRSGGSGPATGRDRAARRRRAAHCTARRPVDDLPRGIRRRRAGRLRLRLHARPAARPGADAVRVRGRGRASPTAGAASRTP